MSDHLRDPLRDAILDIRYEGGSNIAEKLAAAIRAEIDRRMDMALVEHMANAEAHIKDAPVAVAKPQAAEPQGAPVTTSPGGTLHVSNSAPRRNPYEDDRYYENKFDGSTSLRKLLVQAWNEGAQIAGGRDE